MKQHLKSPWPWIGILLILGFVFWFLILSYRYTALLFWGIAGTWTIYDLLSHIHSQRFRKGLTAMFSILLLLVLLGIGLVEYQVFRAAGGAANPQSQYALVLGAGVNGTAPSRSLSQRLHAALDYMEKYPDTILIVSGGQGSGENISEALCMYQWLTHNGIDPKQIWMEEQATSTEENILYTLELIEERSGIRPQTMAVISSEYHLYRAGLLAQKQGLSILGVPATTTPLPLRLHYAFREVFALLYFWAAG